MLVGNDWLEGLQQGCPVLVLWNWFTEVHLNGSSHQSQQNWFSYLEWYGGLKFSGIH